MSEKPILSKLLITVGYTPRVAKAFAWLILNGSATITSREIERGADLRQPEVHYAIQKLIESGWIKEINVPNSSKPGRPFIQYQFTLTRDQAFNEIKKQLDRQAETLATTTAQIHEAIFPVDAPEEGKPDDHPA